MNQDLRARHLRTWIILGPALVVAVVALLVLRPSGAAGPATSPQRSNP